MLWETQCVYMNSGSTRRAQIYADRDSNNHQNLINCFFVLRPALKIIKIHYIIFSNFTDSRQINKLTVRKTKVICTFVDESD